MKIAIDGSLLGNAIKSLQRLNGAPAMTFQVAGNFLKVIGVNNANAASMTVPCEKKEKDEHKAFTVDTAMFLGMIAKRNKLTLTITESMVQVEEGRYKTELLSQGAEEVEVIPAEFKTSDQVKKLSSKFMALIEKVLPKLELKPLLSTYSTLPIGVRSTKEGTFIACYDNYQAAFYDDPEVKGRVEFILPSNVFTVLYREVKGQDYQLVITDSSVYAFNEVFEAAFATPQEDGESISFEDVVGLYTQLKKLKTKKLTLVTQDLLDCLDNARSIYDKGTIFKFLAKDKKCKLDISSSYGKVTEVISMETAVAEPVEFSCDFNFFSTFLTRAPEKVTLKISDEKMLLQNGNVLYLITLV